MPSLSLQMEKPNPHQVKFHSKTEILVWRFCPKLCAAVPGLFMTLARLVLVLSAEGNEFQP